MTKDPRLFLHDALQAGRDIQTFIQGRTVEQYRQDRQLQAAVERKFGIVGEALRNFRQLAPDLASSIPVLGRAVAFRNILIHGYATIQPATVWSTAKENLPLLLASIEGLLVE